MSFARPYGGAAGLRYAFTHESLPRRAAPLYFSDPNVAQATLQEDGQLVVGPNRDGVQVVHAAGSYRTVQPEFSQVPITHWPGRIIAPGFVHMHLICTSITRNPM